MPEQNSSSFLLLRFGSQADHNVDGSQRWSGEVFFLFLLLEEKFHATVLHPSRGRSKKEDEDRESLSFYEMGHKKVEVFTLCPRWNVLLVKMVRN